MTESFMPDNAVPLDKLTSEQLTIHYLKSIARSTSILALVVVVGVVVGILNAIVPFSH